VRKIRSSRNSIVRNFYGPGASDTLAELIRKRRFPVVGDGAGVWSWIHLHDGPPPPSPP
jgi:hypothetical protein